MGLARPGPLRQGEGHHNRKLSVGAVMIIRRLLAEGVDLSKVARAFGLARSTVEMIQNGKTWNHLPHESGYEHRNNKRGRKVGFKLKKEIDQ